MNKYRVCYRANTIDNIDETGTIVVEANSVNEAIDKVKFDFDGNYTNYSELIDIDITDVIKVEE